jgi:TnpA family transposase
VPVSFLTDDQAASFGRYRVAPSADELARYFHLDDTDRSLVLQRRGAGHRLGFALQLCTVRYLGAFLDDVRSAPEAVVAVLARQLNIADQSALLAYATSRQRIEHAREIQFHFGYRDFSDPVAGYRLARWLYALCWTGTERPSTLFERACTWLLENKVLLPGVTVLERFVSRLRQRVEVRLWTMLCAGLSIDQRIRLEGLLSVPPKSRTSMLDQLRSGPTVVSGPALVRAIGRLQTVRQFDVRLPSTAEIAPSRLASLARYANSSKSTAIARLPPVRRLATLAAFVHTLEATAQDDALAVLEMLLHELFSDAKQADEKSRLRSLKDLDTSAAILANACIFVLDEELPSPRLRSTVFEHIDPDELTLALAEVLTLVRPPQDVFYRELLARYKRVRRYLPAVLKHIRFGAGTGGRDVIAALNYLQVMEVDPKRDIPAPMEVVNSAWQKHVQPGGETLDKRAYMFCTLDRLRLAIKRRDVFVATSWRYADPRKGLLNDVEWQAARPVVCRTLGWSSDSQAVLAALSQELDATYRAVAQRLPANKAVRIETNSGKDELVLSPLDRLEEPQSLVELRAKVRPRMPRVDIPEIVLEIAARTGFMGAFTHISERDSRAADLTTSLCAVLIAQATNTGFEPLVRQDAPALRRDRLAWVEQNYLRAETLSPANARLVAVQNGLKLAHAWGGGEVASADGLRFVVPVRTVHAGYNPKYFGRRPGVTWYNLMSNQFSGLNAITVPGTLRDSLVLLSVVLEQETELQPTQIMTDTGAYSDVMFGLFWLVGYRFSPRLADTGGSRFWRIDPQADYGLLNGIARHKLKPELFVQDWDDILRLAGSLKLGRVPAGGIMRMLMSGDKPTRMGRAIAEFGRIPKTLHTLSFIDDEAQRRATLTQLNRTEGRHSLARAVFHGKRGELRQRYREGQEDQLGALGLVVNMIVLWNTIYMEAVLDQLRAEGCEVRDEDVARLSPLVYDHINMLGRYSFTVPEAVARGELRALRDPNDDLGD